MRATDSPDVCLRPPRAASTAGATVALEFHHAALTISTASASMRRRIEERYGPFVASGRPRGGSAARIMHLELEIDADEGGDRVHPTWVDNPPVSAHGTMDAAELASRGLEARLDWRRAGGRAVIADSLAHVDLLVRVALGVGLLRGGSGTLLHSAGVVRNRWGLAFAGESGAGKSTLAAIARADGHAVLADEMLIATWSGAGTRFCGTPFWHGTERSAPAGGLFLLHHAGRPVVERLPAARALPALMRAGGAPLDLPDVQEAFFSALGRLLSRVPAYSLGFRPDPGFWDEIERLPEFRFWGARAARGRDAAQAPADAAGARRLPVAGGARDRAPEPGR